MNDTSSVEASDFNRRNFLKGGSFATMMMMMGAVELRAAEAAKAEESLEKKYAGEPFPVGVIGCGQQGREILKHLAQLPTANVLGICDTYAPMLKRAGESAPKAKSFDDYHKLLEQKEIKSVIVATPTHQHRQIVEEALKAGKHVYCEAPLAHTAEDTRAIAKAAKAARTSVFQSGLQMRSDPQRRFLLDFLRAGAAGKSIRARAQSNKKHSWRQTSPNPDREQEINWRLRNEVSLGLVGEIGLHQIDVLAWFMNARPVSVTGYGTTLQWADGRDVHDTVHVVFEFPGGVLLTYDATLANSFDADHEMIYGTDAAVMLRQNKAWMFKEVDAPLLGWEVYARKDTFYKETGIALVANATKLVAQGDKPVEDAPFAESPLRYALETFLNNSAEVSNAVEDFNATFDPKDTAALDKYLASIKRQPAAGYKEGFEASMLVIKANEAVQKGQKLVLDKSLFDLA